MHDRGSTVPRRQLGRHLRQLREEAGITVKGACEALEWSPPKLWRIERGKAAVRAVDVRYMCELYGADEKLTEALIALAKATREPGWWHAYGDTIPSWFELYVGLEQAAFGLRVYEPELVPGLLQTADYARAVVKLGEPSLTDDEVDQRVQLRLARQQLLERTLPPPPRLDVIMGEGAIRRMQETPGDMRGQIRHLITMMRRSGVSIGILPAQTRLTPVVNTGAFTILDFPRKGGQPSEPTTVYCQGLTGALYPDQPHGRAVRGHVGEHRRRVPHRRRRDHVLREVGGSIAMTLAGAVWKKSSRSGSQGNCVEVATNLRGIVAVRDSKDREGPVLVFTPEDWRDFLTGIGR